MKKPVLIEIGEWYYKGYFIQLQIHPLLLKYHVFRDSKEQETIGTCATFREAKKLCL